MASPIHESYERGNSAAESVLDVRVADLLRRLAAGSSRDNHLLTEVARLARDLVLLADHVGVTTVTQSRKRYLPTLLVGGSTDRVAEQITGREIDVRGGPAHVAIATRATVISDDADNDDRWPDLAGAMADVGVRSVMATPMLHPTHDSVAAVITFLSTRPDAFSDAIAARAHTMGGVLAVGVGTAVSREQFEAALSSRDVIGQAKGMIMERYRIDAQQAFALLARLSQDSNTPLAVVADSIITAEKIGDVTVTVDTTTT